MPIISPAAPLDASLPITEANVSGLTTDLSTLTTNVAAKQARATLTTKGDIYVATASGVVTRLAVGANGTVLTADSGEATGVKWV